MSYTFTGDNWLKCSDELERRHGEGVNQVRW